MTLTLWHNPRCTKSRQTLALLQDRGQTPEIRLYLTDPPSVAELKTLHRQLARPVIAFVRTQEAAFKEAGLSRSSDDTTLIAAIAKHPILLERPILVAGDRAEIGRPPETILTLLLPLVSSKPSPVDAEIDLKRVTPPRALPVRGIASIASHPVRHSAPSATATIRDSPKARQRPSAPPHRSRQKSSWHCALPVFPSLR